MKSDNLLAVVDPGRDGGGVKTVETEIGNPALGQLGQLSGEEFFQKLLPALVTLALVVGVLTFLFMLITGAIQWISSGGDKQALESARNKVNNAVIGLVVLFVTFAVMQFIEGFFGINILTLDIGPLVIQ